MKDLIAFMRDRGWFALLDWRDAPDAPLDPQYFTRRTAPLKPGFGDFAGIRAIEPGRPELSLLYHALASRAVSVGDDEDRYPTLEQLDTIENFIYALHRPGTGAIYRLAVLSYEYRLAGQTPHRCHADMVFSRTGIARIGSKPMNYIKRERYFANFPTGDEQSPEFAVTGARYALFLCRVVNSTPIASMERERDDNGRTFLFPERKLFSGDVLLDGATYELAESHRTERLASIAAFRIKRGTVELSPPHADLKKPPFTRESRSKDGVPLGDAELVHAARCGDSLVISSVPRDLVRPARIEATKQRAAVKVPRKEKGATDLQYSTLELSHAPGLFSQAAEGIALARRAGYVELRRPSNSPMLVNVRHRLDDPTVDETTNISPNAEQLANGGYWAGLFEDSICDGCVVASPVSSKTLRALGVPAGVLPAFSIVAAPAFFPLAKGMELDQEHRELAGNFLKGGPSPLALLRLPPSRVIREPFALTTAFPADVDHIVEAVDETCTAVLSRASDATCRSAATLDEHRRGGSLPDVASSVLYPGWDVTYAADARGRYYLTTVGLGSPFVEDAKLCAAANGMWPGTSPDSARTYQGSLVAVRGTFGYAYSKTATPLTDEELGIHPNSLAARFAHHASGWDGIHGPFFEKFDRVWVNYADISQVDLVESALNKKIDGSKLRKLTTGELVKRMAALRRALKPFDGHEPRNTPLWLISFETVDWDRLEPFGRALAHDLFPTPIDWKAGHEPLHGRGYLFAFGRTIDLQHEPIQEAGCGRLRRPCDAVFIALVDESLVVATQWDATKCRSESPWHKA